MPSMHYAWALLISMALAVIVTGNHYFVDAIAAIPLVMAFFYVYQLILVQSVKGKSIRG